MAVLPFLITGEVWIVQAHGFCEIHPCKDNLLFHLKFKKAYNFLVNLVICQKLIASRFKLDKSLWHQELLNGHHK